ncbi:MAG: hypothetical protein LW875_05165, partial [Proteobacteria bacterium]|nr:hypothetical protein [Pseudomonadota bacterium]
KAHQGKGTSKLNSAPQSSPMENQPTRISGFSPESKNLALDQFPFEDPQEDQFLNLSPLF